MSTQTTESEHQLSGDWTITGVVTQIDVLADSLEMLSSNQTGRLQVDCGRIHNIDMSGLQLLHVWIECAKMRGIRAQLINLPERMQQTIQRLGLNQSFTDNYLDVA